MTVVIRDKSFRVRHTLPLDDSEACVAIKKQLLLSAAPALHAAHQLYVHVPLCFFHCSFCVYKGELINGRHQAQDFLSDLEAEVALISSVVADIVFGSMFVGGGTVTVLSADQLRQLLSLIVANFRLAAKGTERTVELAPHGLSVEKLDVLAAFGVNRVSMGLQSLNEELLRSVNRPPLPRDRIAQLVRAIHSRPFIDANFDLMVGIPGRTAENLIADFKQLAEWGCRSIMVYIDMRVYRDSARSLEKARLISMVERLAGEFKNEYTLNDGRGVNEYNRFVLSDFGDRPYFATRYSTRHEDEDLFCLGIGRQAQSWNRDLIVSWH